MCMCVWTLSIVYQTDKEKDESFHKKANENRKHVKIKPRKRT